MAHREAALIPREIFDACFRFDFSGRRGARTTAGSTYIEAKPSRRQFAETGWAGYPFAVTRFTAVACDVLGGWSVDQANAWVITVAIQNPEAKIGVAVHMMLEAA